MLVIMSGLPGTGKSAIAEAVAVALPAALVSADPIDVALARAGQPNDQGKAGYEVMKAIARGQLALGYPSWSTRSIPSASSARHTWSGGGRQADSGDPGRLR